MVSFMKKGLVWALCLMLCLASLSTAALSEEDPEVSLFGNEIKTGLDEEDLAQWEQWEAEDAANAEGADMEAAIDPGELDEDIAQQLNGIDESERADIDPTMLETNVKLPDDYFNILLLGVDARNDVKDTGLSDVVMILSIHKETGEIKLASIARDTAVTVPGYKNMYRINVAYKFGGKDGEDGGPKLSMRTVNRNFQMNIDHFVTINFFGLAAIIDSLGGVDIELTKAEANRINYELRKEPLDKVDRQKVKGVEGVHHLDGMQAVAFARIRGLDNDFVRTARQRKLLQALLNLVMQDMNLDKMMDLMTAVLPYVYTNLTASEIFELGSTVLASDLMDKAKAGETLFTEHRLPMDHTFGYKMINGASLVYMNGKNLKKNIDALHEFIYGQSYYEQ